MKRKGWCITSNAGERVWMFILKSVDKKNEVPSLFCEWLFTVDAPDADPTVTNPPKRVKNRNLQGCRTSFDLFHLAFGSQTWWSQKEILRIFECHVMFTMCVREAAGRSATLAEFPLSSVSWVHARLANVKNITRFYGKRPKRHSRTCF